MIDLHPGDTVVVWKFDRLSRSLRDLLHIKELIGQLEAGFRSLTEAIDTTAPAGRMLTQLLGSFADYAKPGFERELIRERTRIGMAAARARNNRLGRPPKLNREQRQEVVEMVSSGRKIAADVARLFKVSAATVSQILADARQARQSRDQDRTEQ